MFRITSQVFEHNKFIPPKYTCDGENISPPLEISGVPESAKSLVLIMDDPDATRGVWAHWLLWNISPDTKEIPENSVPPGTTEGVTSFGRSGYGGHCPPSGTHRYFFKLYALDQAISLPSSADKKKLEEAMEEHILASSELIGLYSRK